MNGAAGRLIGKARRFVNQIFDAADSGTKDRAFISVKQQAGEPDPSVYNDGRTTLDFVHTTDYKMVLIKIATTSDLPAPGKVKEFLAGKRFICVANVDGEICATDNVCPHWGGPLGQGTIENGKLVCPWHHWDYDLKTGATSRKSNVRLTIIKVQIQGDDVFVEL